MNERMNPLYFDTLDGSAAQRTLLKLRKAGKSETIGARLL